MVRRSRAVLRILPAALVIVLGAAAVGACSASEPRSAAADPSAAVASPSSLSLSRAPASASASASASAIASGSALTTASPSALPAASPPAPRRAGKSGPIAVRGYPTSVGSGFAAVALYGGFTRDGSELGVCWSDGGSDDMHCKFVDRAGTARTFSEPFVFDRTDLPADSIDPLSEVALWLRRERIPRLERMPGPDSAGWDLLAPPLKGRWGHAEITLEVREVGPVLAIGGDEVAPPRLELGGRVGAGATVFPYVFSPEPGSPPARFVRMNVLALSPDASELGVVTHAPWMEYDSSYSFARIPVEEFADRVTTLASP